MGQIFINVTSAVIFSIICIIFYLILLYIRRPGKNTKCKDVFISILFFNEYLYNEFKVNEFKVNAVVSEIEYGVKVWRCNEETKQYNKLQNIYNELAKSYSRSPGKIIDKMESDNQLPLKQNISKRMKTFTCLWWKYKNDEDSCYHNYFKQCSLFYK